MPDITLQDFLLTHSQIDANFIADFFMIQNIGKNSQHKPFIIKLDLIAKWLETRKSDLKETLMKSYKKDVDYIIIPVNPQDDKNTKKQIKKRIKTKSKPLVKILLTSDCFKLLCMRSKTIKSEEVRIYYLELEKLVDEYKDYIIKTQEEKIKKLEYELNPDILSKEGHFYVYEIGEYYRIGATKNLKLRFKTHNSSHPQTIRPIITLKHSNPFAIESCVNNLLKQYRIKKDKDFYKVNFLTLINAIKDCGELIDKYKCTNCNINLTGSDLSQHLESHHKDYEGIFTFSLV